MKSEICIAGLDSSVTVVLAHDGHVEAPNWHPDGYLIVNGDGRLFRVDLDAPSLEAIDTGFATRCNNDHGLSPDGTRLAISDHSQHGKSSVYTLPVSGGTPVEVTPRQPSWWHGWSPDGGAIVYAAARDGGPVAPYIAPLEGGEELCLATGFDHCDGPDFSADGAWVWFNGERDGSVDLWRVRPDGRDLQRMTDGDSVDWFPHPSPDGAHVVWLAYPPGTQGHPGGLDVALWLMPQDGGAGRELVRLHGGQGTINVPSWAPDGRRFAFVRYAD
ncbi:hypothetical protein OG2516_13911 [Oceanicola granulosus HTCC2516]|uniref:WD40 repeat protein n=1 Tax=Oceanicola granulosus (strain ATCC BAA-861 / DSM 15982 / KCTC 12143 / HTCC2516) TaxID=314256 RepID=Q2C9Y1_OCEGH|nr:TolB family protein [Oceanicola granulosus]EAR49482.1 hypothetical protein OG2516_13911 [Oceanicola granulosus HTCC2516]